MLFPAERPPNVSDMHEPASGDTPDWLGNQFGFSAYPVLYQSLPEPKPPQKKGRGILPRPLASFLFRFPYPRIALRSASAVVMGFSPN